MGSAWAAIVGAVIGAGGALLSQGLATSSQHKGWVLDCKRQEYRELFDALAAYRVRALRYNAVQMGRSTESLQSLSPGLGDADYRVWSTCEDRIFIRAALRAKHVNEELRDLHVRLVGARPGGGPEWRQEFDALAMRIRQLAWADLKIPESERSETPQNPDGAVDG